MESTWEPVLCVFHDAPAVRPCCEKNKGTAAEDEAEAGARTAVWAEFVVIL